MQKIVFLLALLALGATGYMWYQNTYINESREFINLELKNQVIKVEVARNIFDLQRGLSGRTSLSPNTGMLFVFSSISNPEIWMKDMNFSIDIIFIDEAGKIVEIFQNATPASYLENPPKVFRTLEDARYVLEVPAGTVQDLQLSTGLVIDGIMYLK